MVPDPPLSAPESRPALPRARGSRKGEERKGEEKAWNCLGVWEMRGQWSTGRFEALMAV